MKHRITILIAAVLVFISAANSSAQYTYMVTDLSNLNRPSEAANFVKGDSLIFFTADDGIHGREPWRTNGTSQGTFMIKDIAPLDTSSVDFLDETYYVIDNIFYFTAKSSSPASANCLWRSDGTNAGTYALTAPGYQIRSNIVELNSLIYFFIGGNLWKSDGTPGGTTLVKSGVGSSFTSIVSANGLLFFVGEDATNGTELWKSDGTSSGTILLKDINPGTAPAFDYWANGGDPELTVINDTLYFAANDGVNGSEPWKSDGTANGTVMIKDVNATASSSPSQFIYMNGEIYFSAKDGINTGVSIWKTNGANAGTVNAVTTGTNVSNYFKFTLYNNRIYFVQSVPVAGSPVFTWWCTDGTMAGTQMLLTTTVGLYTSFETVCPFNNSICFPYVDSLNNQALWKYDIQSATFHLIKDLAYSNYDYIDNLVVLNNELIFTAYDSTGMGELWKSDGTPSGTLLLKDINQVEDSYIYNTIALNGKAVFSARDVLHGTQLWKSNGNYSGTSMIHEIDPNNNNYSFYDRIAYKNKIYFTGPDYSLWTTDGTYQNTAPFPVSISYGNYSVFNDTLYIKSGNNLWMSDGTTAGTQQIYSGNYDDFYISGDKTFITDMNSVYLVTPSGNTLIQTLNNYPTFIGSWQDTVFYYGSIQTTDTIWIDSLNYVTVPLIETCIYKTGGSGYEMVSENTYPDCYFIFNGALHIFMNDNKNDKAGLFRYESATGLVQVKSWYYPTAPYFSSPTVAGNKFFFTTNDSLFASEVEDLWVSDGTTAATTKIASLNIAGTFLNNLIPHDTTVYFSATTSAHGSELWMSDGTAAGTQLVADVNLNGNSNPAFLTIAGDYLFFSADDGIHGTELWAHAFSTTADCFSYYDAAYDTAANNFVLTIDPITISQATGFYWDFGDGTFSNLQNPTHTYAADDIYNVCLTIYSNSGDTCHYCHEIGKDNFGNILLRSTGFTLSVVNGVAGIPDPLKEPSKITLAPNPTNGEFSILLNNIESNATIRIYSMDGKLVLQKKITDRSPVSISEQQSGIYIVEITENNNISRLPLIKY